MNLGEKFAAAYWENLGLRARPFSKDEMRRGKTPDFRVFQQDELLLFCEAKHVQRDNWLDRRLTPGARFRRQPEQIERREESRRR